MKQVQDVYDLLLRAIHQKKEVVIKYSTYPGELTVQSVHPLAYGWDVHDLPFLWAFLPDYDCYYKYQIELIMTVKLTRKAFTATKIRYPNTFKDFIECDAVID